MKPALTIDPEFQKLIPPLSAQEFASLKQQIIEQGCLEPLYAWKDGDNRILLDGHNRYTICTEVNRGYETRNVVLASREHAKLWILEHQMGRRNVVLTDDQRAVMWNEIRELRSKVAQAEKLQKAREAKAGAPISARPTEIAPAKKDTRAEVAKEAKLPENKLRQAQRLKKHQPDLYEKVRNGTLTLRHASKGIRAGARKQARKDRDYFCRVTRALRKAFRGAVREKLDDLSRLTAAETTELAQEGIREVVLALNEVSASATSYVTKLRSVLQSKKTEAA
jgi:hypothetical protein